MTEQREREIRWLERLRAACRSEAKRRVPDQPQLTGIGLSSTTSPEWRALYDSLQDAKYYDAPPGQWVRCVDKAIRALSKKAPRAKSKAGAR